MIHRGFSALAIGTLVAGLLLTQNGCNSARAGGKNRAKLVPAAGKVSYKGSPVVGATVTFHAADGLHSAVGITDAEGRFQLTTYEANDGVVAGTHKVTVVKLNVSEEEVILEDDPRYTGAPVAEKAPQLALPAKYATRETTDLTASVLGGQSNEITLELTGEVATPRRR